MYDFLRKVPLFSSLSDEDLEQLCKMITEVKLRAGETLFTEGSLGDQAYVIKEGQIEIFKHSGGRSVHLAVRQPGEVIGEMSLLESSPRNASGRALADSVLLTISHHHLDELLNTSTSAARTMLHSYGARLKSQEIVLQQSEKMVQLGKMTAGIAHELNNPAAATRRGADQLSQAVEALQQAQEQLGRCGLENSQLERLRELADQARSLAARPVLLSSLDRSDREAEIEDWLDDRGIADPWQYSAVLVDMGLSLDELAELEGTLLEAPSDCSSQVLEAAVRWLGASFNVHSLLEEVRLGAGRISEIVKALKSYSFLDQAPIQSIDVHEGLDNTCVMLRSILKEGIRLHREYDPNLPQIQAYGSELNQVWTNLISNAADALNGQGEITLRTRSRPPFVVVEVEDNGPGIPEEIQPKIFSPFFTTKAVGQGTGLGLHISYNIVQKHGGEIEVDSKPGKTRFIITLPVRLEDAQSGETPLQVHERADDQTLLHILDTTRTIAVVGIGSNPKDPNLSVPTFLQQNGYRIIPVNPTIEEALGQKPYPDLLAVPEPVDLVLVFRKPEAVREVVEQAIQIGAKGVWMQEGIINEQAARLGREAGLFVVMDTCMRTTYKRLKQNPSPAPA